MSEEKPKPYSVLMLVTMVICLAFGANAWKSNLRIKQIIIDGNQIVGINEINQLIHLQIGTLLYEADLTNIQHSVMCDHYIKDAVVERNLPNSIHIQVVERIPIAIVDRTETLYLDEEGIVLPRSVSHKLLDLPMISGINENELFTLGSSIKQTDVVETLVLLAAMKMVNRPLYHNISEVRVRNGGDIVLYSSDGGVPIIFGRGELANKLVRLETFWDSIVRSKGTQSLQYVDLRYQDQIVALWNSDQSSANGI